MNDKLVKHHCHLIEKFSLSIELRRLSIETINDYKYTLGNFYDFCIKQSIKLTSLTENQAKDYVFSLSSRGLATNTINKYILIVRMFYSFLISEDLVGKNCFVDIRASKREKLMLDQVSIFQIGNLFENIKIRQRFGIRDIAIFELLYGTGIRVTELIELRLANLDLKEEQLVINGTDKRKTRIVPLPSGIIFIFKEYLQIHKSCGPFSNFIFPNQSGKKMHRDSVYKIIKEFLVLTGSKKKGASTIRNSYTSHLLNLGADITQVQLLLGLKSPSAAILDQPHYNSYLLEQYKKAHPRA